MSKGVLGLTTVDDSVAFLYNVLLGSISLVGDLEERLHKHLLWIYIVNNYNFVIHFDTTVAQILQTNPHLEYGIKFNAALIDRFYDEHISNSLRDQFELWEDRRGLFSEWYIRQALIHPYSTNPLGNVLCSQ